MNQSPSAPNVLVWVCVLMLGYKIVPFAEWLIKLMSMRNVLTVIGFQDLVAQVPELNLFTLLDSALSPQFSLKMISFFYAGVRIQISLTIAMVLMTIILLQMRHQVKLPNKKGS